MIFILAEKKDQRDSYAAGLGKVVKTVGNVVHVQSDMFDDEIHIGMASGHLFETLSPDKLSEKWAKWDYQDLPIMPKEMKYQIISGKQKMFNDIKREVKAADEVIVATDIDNEGEKIGYELLERVDGGLGKWHRRLWNTSLTKKSVRHSFSGLHDASETRKRVDAANAREKADYYVGMTMSRVAGIKLSAMGYPKINSVGRVATAILSFVVANDRAIKNFKSQKYQTVSLVDAQGVQFKLDQKFFDPVELQTLLKAMPPVVAISEVKLEEDKHEAAPTLFSLADVQGAASSQFGYSSKQTLDICESLYQKGYQSYPRSEVKQISKFDFESIQSRLPELQQLAQMDFDAVNQEPRKKFVFSDKKTPEHIALTPTDKLPNLANLSADEKNIYLLVLRRALLMFAPDYIFDASTVTISQSGYDFKATGRVTKSLGWRELEDSKPDENQLPDYQQGEKINIKTHVSEHTTKADRRLTESYLIKTLLVKYNIGTSATKGDIIDKLINRFHFVKENSKKELFPTDAGNVLYDFLSGTVLTDPKMTATWDTALVGIAKGQIDADKFVSIVEQFCQKMVDYYRDKVPEISIEPFSKPGERSTNVKKQASDYECPKCQKGHLQLITGTKLGKDYKFYGCDNPKCKFSLFANVAGHELTAEDIQLLLAGSETKVYGFRGSNGPFRASITLNKQFKTKLHYAD